MASMESKGSMGIKTKAGYEYLLAYKISVPIYDYTVVFCKRCQSPNYPYSPDLPKFPPLSSTRTFDQMVQASRSGMTNVPEGNQSSSLEGYIKLTGVSHASLEELLKDYLSYARQNNLEIWEKEEVVRRVSGACDNKVVLRELREVWEILKLPYLPDLPNFPDLPLNPTSAVNFLITLTNQAIYLQKKLKASLEEKFVKEGGFRENLFKKRMEERKKR